MWPKSNNIAVFALDLKSTYEGEHMISGLLSLANLAQNDVLQFHPFTWEWMKKMWYTMEFYSAMKKNEILSFTSKW
jgi:hypothetical protein